jgi:diguanylate cyclase
MLGEHGLTASVVNLSLCYEYVSGRDRALREAFDAALTRARPLPEATAQDLYRRFIWDEDKRRFEHLRAELRTLVSETLTGVTEAQHQASRSADSLQQQSARLEHGSSLDEVRLVLAEVVSEARTMARNSHLMKQMLEDTRRDVDNLRNELEKTRQQVLVDALTGLKNRRAFEAALQEACGPTGKQEGELTLLLVDIDRFKEINDSYGHLVGDKVIRHVGSLLSANVKGKDVVARVGGEEFAVLLPETPMANAERVAEALRGVVERGRLKRANTGETVGRVTISVGLTAYHAGESTEDFMGRADRALYAAKQAGRNRVSALAATAHS